MTCYIFILFTTIFVVRPNVSVSICHELLQRLKLVI